MLQQIMFLDPVVDDWAHIKARTLVLGGDKDGENFPALAKHIADTVPHGELVLIPGAGHVPHEVVLVGWTKKRQSLDRAAG